MARNQPTSTALATPLPPTAQTMAVRDGIDQTDRRGKENFDTSDLLLPRLAIVQRTSAEIEPDSDRYIAGAKFTDLFNSITRENFGNGPITILPLGFRKKAIEFEPGGTGVVIDRDVPVDVDPETGLYKDARLNFNGDEKPTATVFYEFPIVIIGDGRQDIAVLSLKGTQIKTAREFITVINFRGGAAWDGQYTVTSTSKKFPKGPAGMFVIRAAGATSAADADIAARAYALLQTKNIVVDDPIERDDADTDL